MTGDHVTTGVIESASVTGHAPAGSIRYTIVVSTPNGGVDRLRNARPIGVTYTDLYGVDVIPHPRGTPVTVSYVAGRVMVYGEREAFYAVDCEGNPIDPRPIIPINDPVTGLPNTQPESGGGGGLSGGSVGGGGAVGSDGSSGSDGEYMGGFIGMPKYIQGMVTRQNTFGGNPAGPDDSYRKTQLGEYVIKKSAVQKYGRGLLDMINSESIPKTKLRGLL